MIETDDTLIVDLGRIHWGAVRRLISACNQAAGGPVKCVESSGFLSRVFTITGPATKLHALRNRLQAAQLN